MDDFWICVELRLILKKPMETEGSRSGSPNLVFAPNSVAWYSTLHFMNYGYARNTHGSPQFLHKIELVKLTKQSGT